MKDVWEDTKDTLRGRGISYQAYEPAEGALHHDIGRQKRIRAGLRYSKGGKAKYWLRMPGEEGRHQGTTGTIASVRRRMNERLAAREGYAPLLPHQAADVIHDDPDEEEEYPRTSAGLFDSDSGESDAASLDFDSANEEEDALYERARRIGYAGFPNVDVSQEEKKRKLWEEEQGILAGKWSRGASRERLGDASGEGDRAKGKGKDPKGKKAVYGACEYKLSLSVCLALLTMTGADRSPAKSQQSVPNGHPMHQDKAYDGDNEHLRPPTVDGVKGAGRGKGKGKGKDAMEDAQMRWTKNDISEGMQTKSPFTLTDGDDGEEDQDQSQPQPDNRSSKSKSNNSKTQSALPSDAVDLVVEDSAAVEAARTMHRADSQNRVPTHIYRHTQAAPDSKGKAQAQQVEEVYEDGHGPGADTTEMLNEDEAPVVGADEVLEHIEETVGRDDEARGINTGTGGVSTPYDEENPWA